MRLPLYRHPGIRDSRLDALYRRLRIIGVGTFGITGGSSVQFAPSYAAPATVTASATSDTDGSATTITAAGDFNSRDWLLTYVVYSSTASANWRGRLKINVGGTTRRQITVGSTYSSVNSKQWCITQPIFPLRIPAGTNIDLVMATDDGASTRSIDCYLMGVFIDRFSPHPHGLKPTYAAANSVGPNASQVTLTADAVAWTFGSSQFVVSGLTTSILLTAVTLSPGTANTNGGVNLSRGGGNVIDVSHTKITDTAWGSGVRYDLSQSPILVTPGAIPAVYASSVGGSTCVVGIEYVPL